MEITMNSMELDAQCSGETSWHYNTPTHGWIPCQKSSRNGRMGPFCLGENEDEGQANAEETGLETGQDVREGLFGQIKANLGE